MGLYRPTVVRQRKNGTKYRTKTALWWGSYRHPVSDTLVRVPLKTGDRKAAAIQLREHERRAAREFDGSISRCAQHAAEPLEHHLADFERSLIDKGDGRGYAEMTAQRVRRVLALCGFVFYADIQASRVATAISGLGGSDRTRGYYVQALKQFSRWLVADARAERNPLEHLKRGKVTDERRRRALMVDEMRKLLAAARVGPEVEGLPGGERAVLYELAVTTGLRRGELATLKWGCVNLPERTVTVRGAYAKNRREDTLPLTPRMASILAAWRTRAGVVDSTCPVFPNLVRDVNMAECVRADLKAAGIAFETDAGRADFHSLRHTFITNLARAGVTPKVAQDLARHSDINLTLSRYTHTVLSERAAAVQVLPDLSPDTETAQERCTDVA